MRKITINDNMTDSQFEEIYNWLTSLKDGDEDYFIARASGFTDEAVYAFDYKIITAFGLTLMVVQKLDYNVVCINVEDPCALDVFLNKVFAQHCLHSYDLIF